MVGISRNEVIVLSDMFIYSTLRSCNIYIYITFYYILQKLHMLVYVCVFEVVYNYFSVWGWRTITHCPKKTVTE